MAKINVKAVFDACRVMVNDIEQQYAKDKEAKIDQETLDTLENAFASILEFEKTHLITAHDQFYGCMLMSMETEINFKQRGPIDISVVKEPFVVSFNPIYCVKYKYAEFTGLLVSEILKIAYSHPASYAKLNHEKDENKHDNLEKASSASVADMVKRDIRLDSNNKTLRLPDDAYTTSKINEDCSITPKQNESLEYYYHVLEKFKKKKDGQGNNGGASGQMPGQGKSNGQAGDGQVATPNNDKGEGVHNWEGNDPDETQDLIKCMVGNVWNNMTDKQRGLVPAGLQQAIKTLLAPPEINWKQLLRKLVGTIPVPYRKTRRRLNRRQPLRPDLCGKLPKRVVDVVCVFDTSGSMSDRDLAYCMNEVFNIVKIYEGAKITIIECDAEVNRVYQAKNMSELKTKMSGRGGTYFTPAIEFINGDKKYAKNPLSGKYRNSLMVYFTDGYGESEIPKPRTYRNLWVVLHDVKCLSVKEPYGEVKSLSMDKDWIKLRKGYDW